MTSSALAAVAYLQQQSTRFDDIYELERHDRALDEIVANLDRPAPTPFQARSALANAAKVIRKRRTVRTFGNLDKPLSNGQLPDVGHLDESFVLVEIRQWIDTSPSLRVADRRLLRELARGEDAVSLAGCYCVPVARMRERIARVRAVSRLAYRREVG